MSIKKDFPMSIWEMNTWYMRDLLARDYPKMYSGLDNFKKYSHEDIKIIYLSLYKRGLGR
jgi:hypothetical protein